MLIKVNKMRPLTKEQSQELAERYAKERRREDMDRLVEGNMRLVAYLVRKYAIPDTVLYETFFSYGCEGLMIAIEEYDPSRNTHFGVWAHNRTRWHMLHASRRERERILKYQYTFHPIDDFPLEADIPDPADHAAKEYDRDRIRHAIGTMKKNHQRYLRRYYNDNLTYQEVAEAEGVTRQNAHRVIQHARALLSRNPELRRIAL